MGDVEAERERLGFVRREAKGGEGRRRVGDWREIGEVGARSGREIREELLAGREIGEIEGDRGDGVPMRRKSTTVTPVSGDAAIM